MVKSFTISNRGLYSRISARVPQGSVLKPLLYLLYTTDIPTTEIIVLDIFANDSAIMAIDAAQEKGTEKLQAAINNVSQWTRLENHIQWSKGDSRHMHAHKNSDQYYILLYYKLSLQNIFIYILMED